MPRTPRPWDPNAVHHIDARAHGGAPIFATDDDRAFVVERASRVFAETGAVSLAWSVLVNHYHFLVRCPGPPGKPIQRLNTAIARRVRRRGGQGAVFQGRFFSEMCTDEASLLVRLAYVTANPVHHHVVPTIGALRTWPWSSLGEVLGLRDARLVQPAAVLAIVDSSGDQDRARASLAALLEMRARLWAERDTETGRAPDEDEPPEPAIAVPRRLSDELGLPRTLGAVAGPIPAAAREAWETGAARRAVLRAAGWTPDRLIPVACALFGADADAVRRGRRTRRESRARAVVAHVACDHVGWRQSDVAACVGTNGSSVLRARPRGAATLATTALSADELVRRSRA